MGDCNISHNDGSDHSNVIQSVEQGLRNFFSPKNLGYEVRTLFGVLKDRGHIDGAGPVDVVEILTEDDFLEGRLLKFGVAVDNFVVVLHC